MNDDNNKIYGHLLENLDYKEVEFAQIPNKIQCKDIYDLIKQIRESGLKVYTSDDPLELSIGYMAADGSAWWTLSIKNAVSSAVYGSCFKTVAGREKFLTLLND